MEGNKKTKPRAILVFGAPCSGKTTFCEKFSRRFKAPYYNLQQLREEADFTEKQIHVVLEAIRKLDKTLLSKVDSIPKLNAKALRSFLNSVVTILHSFGFRPTLIQSKLA